MTSTFLKRYFFDDRKLRQRTLVELVRSLENDRLVCVVGSMATESFGYGDWASLQTDYFERAKAVLKNSSGGVNVDPRKVSARQSLHFLAERIAAEERPLNAQVALSAAREIVRGVDEQRNLGRPDGSRRSVATSRMSITLVERLDRAIAKRFAQPAGCLVPAADTIAALIDSLGMSRFVTLNYDVELERATMLDGPRASRDASPVRGLEQLRQLDRIVEDDRVPKRWTRTLPNGMSIESDIFNRERPDRLIEFALGSATVDQHILHLHGRADAPESLVVGLRDYDRLYRQTHPSRLPFREGLRALFAGNPILFVGLGMNEAEVNDTLQSFVSDNPYRYQAPIFLIWNSYNYPEAEKSARQRAARLDWLMRLGVLVIFDDDLGSDVLSDLLSKSRGDDAAAKTSRLQLLRATVEDLAETAVDVRRRMQRVGERFRETRTRIEASEHSRPGGDTSVKGRVTRPGQGQVNPLNSISLWAPLEDDANAAGAFPPDWMLEAFEKSPSSPLVLIGRPGIGKGRLGRQIFTSAFAEDVHHRMHINAGFCFDTDSLADAMVRFLGKLQREVHGPLGLFAPARSREQLLADPTAFTRCARGLVIINGIDRFFTPEGVPLSVEFDQFLRTVGQGARVDSQVRFVFLGTDRVSLYFDRIACCRVIAIGGTSTRDQVDDKPYRYLDALAKVFQTGRPPAAAARIAAARATSTSSQALRQAVVADSLDQRNFGTDAGYGALKADILRTLAFIGMPVEAAVLLHAPVIRQSLRARASLSSADWCESASDELCRALRELCEAKLVILFGSFEDYPGCERGREPPALWRRYGLHRTVMSELRERHGVPLTRSKRATAFNMSLYTAQPVDSDTPEAHVHEELAHLIDRLIGTYRDDFCAAEKPQVPPTAEVETAIRKEAAECRPALPDDDDKLRQLTAPVCVAALRTALAVVRGYYSTTTLLTIDRGQRWTGEDRDGALLEHAERLERLLRGYRKLTRFREAAVRALQGNAPYSSTDDLGSAYEWSTRQNRLLIVGPEPFYPDELVWLYNELGTVRLAQGDLYAARTAFDRAIVENGRVEHGDHSHNWRRITLNAVMVEIERGRIETAEDHLRQVEATIDRRHDPSPPSEAADRGAGNATGDRLRSSTRRTMRILRTFAGPEEARGGSVDLSIVHPDFLHEEILATGLVSCMRGLTEHLRGHLRTAKARYQEGIRILRRLGEHRAYALFQRYYAQLLRAIGEVEQHRIEIGLAVAAAESVRQMDFVYPARMIQSEADDGREGRGDYLQQAVAAQDYAMMTDIHRVRVDAATRLARAKLSSGDYEMALDHATDALATAARFGMSLRKIGLRILMGQILIRRGDMRSGTALIDAAIEQADRIGYQRAVALAQRVRSSEAITT